MSESTTTAYDEVPAASVPAYLIYIVLDTSKSMWRTPRGGNPASTPMEVFKRNIPRMLLKLALDPLVNQLTSISVVAFNDRPEVLRPIGSLEHAATIRPPSKGFGTDYRGVLRFLIGQHRKDVRDVKLSRARENYPIDVARPWIFFITDGRAYAQGVDQPDSAWLPERDELAGPPIGARVVTLGLPGADEDALWLLATGDDHGSRNAFIANDPRDTVALSAGVCTAIGSSIGASTGSGTLIIKPPPGMSQVRGPRRARG